MMVGRMFAESERAGVAQAPGPAHRCDPRLRNTSGKVGDPTLARTASSTSATPRQRFYRPPAVVRASEGDGADVAEEAEQSVGGSRFLASSISQVPESILMV